MYEVGSYRCLNKSLNLKFTNCTMAFQTFRVIKSIEAIWNKPLSAIAQHFLLCLYRFNICQNTCCNVLELRYCALGAASIVGASDFFPYLTGWIGAKKLQPSKSCNNPLGFLVLHTSQWLCGMVKILRIDERIHRQTSGTACAVPRPSPLPLCSIRYGGISIFKICVWNNCKLTRYTNQIAFFGLNHEASLQNLGMYDVKKTCILYSLLIGCVEIQD